MCRLFILSSNDFKLLIYITLTKDSFVNQWLNKNVSVLLSNSYVVTGFDVISTKFILKIRNTFSIVPQNIWNWLFYVFDRTLL